MSAESTSVHWHGQHQRLHPYMDGVPHVTQCPIPPGNTFRYEFEAENPGTQFWHSHIGKKTKKKKNKKPKQKKKKK